VCGNGKVYSIDPDGNESPKETVPPQFVAAGQAGLVGAPVLADSDGDGRSEVFVATSSGSSGTLLCSDQEGRGRWRRDHSSSFAKGPVVGGPDRRGRLRVLAGGSDGMVLCCDAQTGRVQWTWQFDQTVNGGLAFADLDGDGLHDVLAGDTAGSLCAVSGTESPTLWVRRVHHEVGDSPVLLDLDGSGTSSILYTGQVDCVTCLRGNGALSWRFPTRGWVVGGVTASDLDGDRRPEVLFGSFDRRVYCLRGGADSARSLWQEGGRDGLFVGREVAARPLVVDLERDERLEVLVGDWNHDLHCFAPSGERRWPRPAGGRLSNEPRLGLLLAEDLDADGILELIAIDETNKLCCFARQPGGGTWGAIWRFESSQLPRFLHNQRTQRLELVVREAIGDRLVVLGAAGEVSRVLLHGKGIAVHYWTLDLNGDGGTEVLALDDVSGFPLRALSPDGAERWRIDLGSDSTCEPALSDFDGDGVDELLVLLQSGEGKFLDPKTGALLGGLDLGVKKAHGFAVGNVGDDKRPEIVVAGADQCLYCFRVPEGTISR
jgi:outer membrane protein assembly factor BamB